MSVRGITDKMSLARKKSQVWERGGAGEEGSTEGCKGG